MCSQDVLYKVTKKDMSNRLHKLHVAIVWRSPTSNITGRGTGLMISRDLVLTTAHNFYHESNRVDNSLIKIYPSQHGKLGKHY